MLNPPLLIAFHALVQRAMLHLLPVQDTKHCPWLWSATRVNSTSETPAMSNARSRSQYAQDLLQDVLEAMRREAEEGGGPLTASPEVCAALILSDSFNGLRRAVLDLSEATRQRR